MILIIDADSDSDYDDSDSDYVLDGYDSDANFNDDYNYEKILN